MLRGFVAAFVGLCLVTGARCAALSTTDTLVVVMDSSSSSSAPFAETTQQSTTPVAVTEAPESPIKLSEMIVTSEVALRYANTAVVTKVRNQAKKAQEATFRVLLPETAFISGFTMILDGKSYKAYVREKDEAKKIYNQAVSQGLGAAHVAAKARDSNHFSVSVNVEPNTEALFNLTYEELLERRNGVYNHAINLHPGALVPKLTVTVHIREEQGIKELRVPEVRTGNEIDATEDDKQNEKVKIEKSSNGREATITFTPDLEEQKKLMDVYAAKSRESQNSQSRPWYRPEPEEEVAAAGTLGQFVVQYDVDRPKEGEILINDGYFVHFFAPSSLPPLNKHVVFVLDTSGSMSDRKIVQLREAMRAILDDLNEGDYFNIVEFSTLVTVHDLAEAKQNVTKALDNYYPYDSELARNVTLVPPEAATKNNIAMAKIIVNRMDASGGTNIGSALATAIKLVHKGVGWTPDNVDNNKTSTEKPTDKKEPPELQPIVIFLTDGEPTVGESDTRRLITQLSEQNYGKRKAAIFSLAFGEDADRSFLRKLSLKNEGFMKHIYEAADAVLQLQHFYKQVSSPLLSDVKFVYPPNQVNEESLTKHTFHTYYSGSEAVVAGKLAADSTEVAPEVLAFCGVDDSYTRKKYRVTPRKAVSRNRSYYPLERLWAYLTVKQLLDARDASDEPQDTTDEKPDKIEKKALDIALKYEFVTPLTSLVVVKPNATDAVNAESLDKQSGLALSAFGATGKFPSVQKFALRTAQLASYNIGSPGLPGPSGFAGAPAGGGYPIFAAPGALSVSDVAAEAEYEEEAFLTTPAPPPPVEDELKQLIKFQWLYNYVNYYEDTISFIANGTDVTLKLSRDPTNYPGEGESCPSIGGASGVCTYLPLCDSVKDITFDVYQTIYCNRDGFAGVCCPKKEEAKTSK